MLTSIASRAGRSVRASARRGGASGGLSSTDRRNMLLRFATQAKLAAGFQRDINAFAAGFKGASDAADGIYIAGSSGYTRNASAGCVKPTIEPGASYSNPLGTGDRTAIITVTSTIATGSAGGTPSNLVDGAIAGNSSDAWHMTNGATTGYIQFDLGSAKVVTEFKWHQDSTSTHGMWKLQGSNTVGGASGYVDIGSSFTLGGVSGAQTVTAPSANTTAYRYYRLTIVSGSTSNAPLNLEIEFKIGNVAADVAADSTVQFLQQTVDSTGHVFAVADVHPVEAMIIGTTYIMEVYAGGSWQAMTMVNAGIGEGGRTVVGAYIGGLTPATTVDIRIRTVGKDHRTYRFGYDARNAP